MAKIIDAIIQLRDNFSAQMEKVENSIVKVQRQAQRLAKDIQKQAKTIQGFGETMTKYVTLPVIGGLTMATKWSLDFSDAMAKVATIADTTAVPIEKLRQGIINLSNATGMSVTDLAEAEYQAISAGVSTAESIQFLEAAVKAAKAGFSDMVTVVDGLTSVLNSYGLSAKEAARISNQMMIAQNLGKTTIDEMARSIGLVAPIASSAGLKTEELFTNLAVLTAQGLKTSEAITGLKQAISNVINPSDQAKKAADALSIQFSASAIKSKGWLNFLLDVRKALERAAPEYMQAVDRQAKLKAQIEALQKHSKGHKEELQRLREEYKKVSNQVKALEDASRGQIEGFATMFGSVEALNAVLALTSEAGIKMYTNAMKQMNTQTDVVDEALRKLQTPGEQLRKSLNRLKNEAIQFGDMLAPAVSQVADMINKVVKWFDSLTPKQKQTLLQLLMYAAAMGPVIKALGVVYGGVGKAVKGFSDFAKALKTTGTIFGALRSTILSPANLIFLAIVALAVVTYLVIRNWDKIKAKAQEVGKAFIAFKDSAIEKVKLAIETIRNKFIAFENFLKRHKGTIETIAKVLLVIFGPSLIKTGVQATIAGSKIAANYIGNLIKAGIQATISAAKTTATLIPSLIKTGAQAVVAGAKMTGSFIASLIKTGLQATRTAAIITGRLVLAMVRYALQGWQTIAVVLKTIVVWTAQRAIMLGTAVAMRIAAAAQWALNAAMRANPIGLVITLVAGLIIAFIALYRHSDRVRRMVNSLWTGLKTGAISAINVVISLLNKLIDALNKIHFKVPSWVPGFGGKEFGFNIPKIPMLAQGTNYFQGGPAIVGEKGPELVYLPRGSKVVDSKKTEKILSSKKNISVTINVEKMEVRSEADLKKFAELFVNMLEKEALNYGGAV